MMTTKPIGLYLHIPFCLKKCNYCDFCSFPIADCDWKDNYLESIYREIESYRGRHITVDSIFFGGGTPTLLSTDEFEKITSRIYECFAITDDVEFTVEANPKTLDCEKLSSLVACGVNRLSIGLQSIHENEQKILGRIHNLDDFLKLYNAARINGVRNINVDLMYGIPEQTEESFIETLDTVINLSPDHISLYGLILEENTPFYDMQDSLDLPNEDAECDMYYLAASKLKELGYEHYEISNYAKAGYFCRHNLKYWRDREYIGIGIAAHSYFGGIRYSNTENIREYLSEDYEKYRKSCVVDSESEAYEYVMLALRLKEGISLSEYFDKFKVDFRIGREDILEKLLLGGYINISEDRLSLTEKGFYVSNNILAELI